MHEEYEIVEHNQIRDMNIFLVEMTYRRPHLHREFEICMVLSGEVDIYTERKSYRFRRGGLMIFNPGQTHEIHAITENSLILSLQAASGLFKRIYPDITSLRFDDVCISGGGYGEGVKGNELRSLCRKLLELSLTYLEKGDGYEFFCMSGFAEVFGRLMVSRPWHLISEKEKQDSLTKGERLKRILDYIEENYTEKLLLSDIAETENLSVYYLSHFFKEMLGMSFQDYLAVTRFETARRLVEHSDKSLTEICLECGFSDYRYLNKIYQKQLGYTPMEYRRSHEILPPSTAERADLIDTQRFFSDGDSVKLINLSLQKYNQSTAN